MPINFRRPIWLSFVVFCLVAGLYSWFYFPEAFPIVDLEITMDRRSALQRAEDRARKHDLGPREFNQAASFQHDNQVQSFVELEGGGKDEFRRMIDKEYYQPYQWHVRHYRPGKTRETLLRFTPSGELYGFKEKWPENDTGAALQSDRALEIAKRRAVNHWNVDLQNYELISRGQEERASGRVDHTFTYERKDVRIGEGRYRLRLGVNGSRLSEVTYFVKVPEGFTRRYKNMRSANSLIQNVGNVFVYVVYLLMGCLFGAYWLLKNDALKWRKAVYWGGGITLLQFLSQLNSMPLSWMNYDTAMAPGSFLAQQIVSALSSTLLFGVIITITFITAEGLTRQAFDHHPKLWRLWNPVAAGSKTVAGLTLFGFLLIGPYFAYNVALYSFAYESLGWWSPSNLLYDPNILAHYVTWLKPVINSLQAGFWEECLFRAVPIAGAALLGSRYGRRRWWIGTALVLQALVFGAGHASYATQPSYARVVELFSSSIALGLIYIGYGLLPSVIAHYLYDLILMALPIFVSNAPGIWVSQSFVVLFGIIPLLVVVWGRFYNGEWISLPDRFWNGYRSDSKQSDTSRTQSRVPEGVTVRRAGMVAAFGLIGFLFWGYYGTFETYEIPLTDTKNQVRSQADDLLEATGDTPSNWLKGATVSAGLGDDDGFVWQEGNKDDYKKLMGSYLKGPYWTVRYFTFRGSVEERAEEYRARLSTNQNFREIQHYLPESAPGDSISELKATTIADSAIVSNYGLKKKEVKQISAEPTPRPNRRDWVIEYEVPGDNPLKRGETRVKVTILGSEVTDTSRYFHVPETWERDNRNRKQLVGLVGTSADTLLYLIVLAGAFAGIIFWGQGRKFSLPAVLLVLGILISLALARTINEWPTMVARFDTAEPYWNQVFIVLSQRIGILLRAAVLSLVAGLVHGQLGTNRSVSLPCSLTIGVGIGALGAGMIALSGWMAPDLVPQWGTYASLDKLVPQLHHTITGLRTLIVGSLLLLLVAVAYFQITRGGVQYNRTAIVLAAVFGVIVASNGSFTSIRQWWIQSILYAGLFGIGSAVLLLRDRSFVPMTVGTVIIFDKTHVLLTSSHAYVLTGVLLSSVVVLVTAGYWTVILQRLQRGEG